MGVGLTLLHWDAQASASLPGPEVTHSAVAWRWSVRQLKGFIDPMFWPNLHLPTSVPLLTYFISFTWNGIPTQSHYLEWYCPIWKIQFMVTSVKGELFFLWFLWPCCSKCGPSAAASVSPWDLSAMMQSLGLQPQTYPSESAVFIPVFVVALFTIAKTWKQPKGPSTEEWIKKMWYIYIHWNISHKKEWNNAIYSNMDGPRDYRTKWSKSERERQVSYYDITYMWNLKKWYKSTYLQTRNRLTDLENKVMLTKGGGGGG